MNPVVQIAFVATITPMMVAPLIPTQSSGQPGSIRRSNESLTFGGSRVVLPILEVEVDTFGWDPDIEAEFELFRSSPGYHEIVALAEQAALLDTNLNPDTQGQDNQEAYVKWILTPTDSLPRLAE